ncbi:glycosyltransferase [uncultured Friedmanniella sp.]|uniref:glycosyltransferase n=1 Tax=uncultured Friedmanniella sp. TaxID=335381 RepID=UPI0035CC3E1F
MTAPRRLKVAYFVPPSAHFAGIERVVHEIASGLAEQHPRLLDVHVVFSSSYDEEVLRAPGYTMHVLGADRLRQLGASLRRCVADQDFDVLITPQVEASVVAWTVTRGLRLPVLLPHLHGNPRLEEAEGTRRTRAAFVAFRSLVSRDVPAVLAVSPSLRDHAALTVARRTRTVFAKNPVRDLGSPEPLAATDDRFRFVCVARLSRQKGQDLLLRALALARPDLPPVELTLVGNGPDEASLRQLCSELELDDVVTFAGYSTDPVQHLRAADCFVLASRWEGFGVALVEALQCGLPLLATDCEFGPADIITDAEIGELVAPESPEALAEGLRRAVRRRRTQEGDAHRRAAAAPYLPAEAVESHFSILSSVAPSA